MKTQWTLRVRLTALAIANLALMGVVGAPVYAADTRPVTPLNGWNGKLGPGIGTVKTPFGVIEVGRALDGRSQDTIYFHTSTGQPVQQVPTTHLGPGPWSSKSPFNRQDTSDTY